MRAIHLIRISCEVKTKDQKKKRKEKKEIIRNVKNQFECHKGETLNNMCFVFISRASIDRRSHQFVSFFFSYVWWRRADTVLFYSNDNVQTKHTQKKNSTQRLILCNQRERNFSLKRYSIWYKKCWMFQSFVRACSFDLFSIV